MLRFFLGFFTAFFILAVGVWSLWVMEEFELLESKKLILQMVGNYPELDDLPTSYELGKKLGVLFKEWRRELEVVSDQLKYREEKLKKEQAALKKEKKFVQQELKKYEALKKKGATSKYATGALSPEEESKVKQFLIEVGSMKPEKVALVLQQLSERAVFMIFEQLQQRQVVKIMELLPADYLAKLTRSKIKRYRGN